MRIAALAAALLLSALALGACGGSSSGTASHVPAGAQAPASTGSQGATTATATTPTTTSPTASNRCTASKLALSFLGQQGATGHGVIGFALKNVTGSSCRTFGYPGVVFLSQSGKPLPTVSTRTTQDFGGTSKLKTLLVAAGSTVSFRLVVTHGINSSKGCTTAYGLQVIPPNDTSTLRVSIPGGAYECGTTMVSPLQAGSSAYG